MTFWHTALLVGSAALAGAINSVAGGGTLLTFPALIAAGQFSNVANATSTVALWPGQLSSLWGYKNEIADNKNILLPLSLIGLAGGIAGAQLLLHTPRGLFDHIVPFLVLTSTVLFMIQEPVSRRQKEKARLAAAKEEPAGQGERTISAASPQLRLGWGTALFLFGVALYGGYFGAGIGILVLAALGFIGLTNIHQMNGIKAFFTLGINGIAALSFALGGIIDWKIAGIMAVGSLFGGWAGAGIAQRIGQKNVRRLVIGIGLVLTVSFFYKAFFRSG